MAALACFCNVSTLCGLKLTNSGHSFCSDGVYKNPCIMNSLVQTLCCPCINGLTDSCHSTKLLKRLSPLFSRLKLLHSCTVSSFTRGVFNQLSAIFSARLYPAFTKRIRSSTYLRAVEGRVCHLPGKGFLAYWLLCGFFSSVFFNLCCCAKRVLGLCSPPSWVVMTR